MFTGLISEVATVVRFEKRSKIALLAVKALKSASEINVGDSVAIDGACLTAVKKQFDEIVFDVSNETLNSSNIGKRRSGDTVNIELAIKAGERFGGHFVLGHVDCTGEIKSIRQPKNESAGHLVISIPESESRNLIIKGSIAVNGVSLTIQEIEGSTFHSVIVPHTWRCTTFKSMKQGDIVNIEFDLLVKTVVNTLVNMNPPNRGISFDKLSDWGY